MQIFNIENILKKYLSEFKFNGFQEFDHGKNITALIDYKEYFIYIDSWLENNEEEFVTIIYKNREQVVAFHNKNLDIALKEVSTYLI